MDKDGSGNPVVEPPANPETDEELDRVYAIGKGQSHAAGLRAVYEAGRGLYARVKSEAAAKAAAERGQPDPAAELRQGYYNADPNGDEPDTDTASRELRQGYYRPDYDGPERRKGAAKGFQARADADDGNRRDGDGADRKRASEAGSSADGALPNRGKA